MAKKEKEIKKGGDTTEVMTSTDPLTASLRDSRKKRACLMVVYGQEVGRRYWLSKDVAVCGRDPEADIHIDNKRLSRRHFAILHKKPKFYLKDLGSRNGTVVNEKTIKDEIELKFGDKIQCGGTVLQFMSEASIEHMLVDKLREDAYRDGLTQVYNKRILPDVEKEMFDRAKVDQHPLGVLMFDIDHFKKLNDTYGHLFGDQVLSGLSKEISSKVMRTQDIMIRFGGEEFLIVLSHPSHKALTGLGERVRKAAAGLRFEDGGKSVTLTVSVGVRYWDPKQEAGVTKLQMLIEQADQALYQSKSAGRNRVTAYTPNDENKDKNKDGA